MTDERDGKGNLLPDVQRLTKVLYERELLSYMKANAHPMIESRFEQSFVQKCLLDFFK